MSEEGLKLTRRSFVGAGVVAAAALTVSTTTGCSKEEGARSEDRAADQYVWNSCAVDCPHRCALRFSMDGQKIRYVFSDNSGEDEFGSYQLRACSRGRASRWLIEDEDRLDKPLKRSGARGSGEFTEVSWDEALDEISDRLSAIISASGNEAIYLQDFAGDRTPTRTVWRRFLNTIGGYSASSDARENAAAAAAIPHLYGLSDMEAASSLTELRNSDLAVFFGNSPAESGPPGGGAMYDLNVVSEQSSTRTILVDPRWSNTATHVDEWIPIRPGTDGALAHALAYVFITEGLADESFLSRYVTGYDGEDGYRAYVLGELPYTPPKTPAWAASITGIPEDRIVKLAREIAGAEAPFITQGWGLARRLNGEQTIRAICMLPILLGKIGLPGTNTGVRERRNPFPLVDPIPEGENPVARKISWGAWQESLGDPIRCIISYHSDHLVTLSGDINRTKELLADEERVELIIAMDTNMTQSCRYADYILPDLYPAERYNLDCTDLADGVEAVIGGSPIYTPVPGERRHAYEVCADLAARFSVEEEFTDFGKNLENWQQQLYDDANSRSDASTMPPDLAALLEKGIWKRELPSVVGLRAFRENPSGNPLPTPSGLIELSSADLGELHREDDFRFAVRALPEYVSDREGYAAHGTSAYNLQLIGFDPVNHAGTDFAHVARLQGLYHDAVWMNPLTAEREGAFQDGDIISVYNGRGSIRIPVKITPRIMPGVLALPKGATPYRGEDTNDVDTGSALNILSGHMPTPLAEGSASNSINVAVRRLENAGR